MSVAITWSLTQNGTAITSLDHGAGSNGQMVAQGGGGSAGVEIWLRHNGANDITNAGFYIAPKSGTYSGSFSPSSDYQELLAWADAVTSPTFGGFHINMNKITSYVSGWSQYNDKQPTGGSAFFTGVGDLPANKILLSTSMGASVTSAGVLAAAGTACAFKCRVEIPTSEDTVGVRQFDQKLRYTYTS